MLTRAFHEGDGAGAAAVVADADHTRLLLVLADMFGSVVRDLSIITGACENDVWESFFDQLDRPVEEFVRKHNL